MKSIMLAAICLALLQSASGGWERKHSGTLAWLRSVYFVDVNRGWIVGSKGTVLVTEDGGDSWRKAKKFTGDNIREVYFSDPQNGWLLCDGDIYSDSKSQSYLLRTSDGGKTWDRINFTDNQDRIIRLFFSEDGYGAAVGEGGNIWQMLDDKKSWKKKSLPSRLLMLDGTFIDTLNGVLVGAGGKILVTSDGGVEWVDAAMPAGSNTRLNSVFFVDQKTGWIGGAHGKVYVTRNGGKAWLEQASGVTEDLTDIFFVDKREGYAVGDKGRIIETKSGGENWTVVDTGVNGKLESVYFIGRKGFAVGFGGIILSHRSS